MRLAPNTKLLVLWAVFTVIQTCLILMADLDMLAACLPVLLFAGVAAADAWQSKTLNEGLAILLPEVIRMSKNKKTSFILKVVNDNRIRKQIKIGMLFPYHRFRAEYYVQTTVDPGQTSSVEWQITGIKGGRHQIDACYIETASRFGLWTIRYKFEIDCELRVYPDMFKERKALASHFLDFGVGVHRLRNVGKGREFERLREYLPGDLYEDIHWKATARRGSPVTKIFQLERTQDVYVMIDASRMSARNVKGFSDSDSSEELSIQTILEQYITTALSIGMAAERQGDNFGLGVFSDQMKKFIPAGKSKQHHKTCRDALYTLETEPVTPDFTECITFIGNKMKKRSLLIILTSLDDPAIAEELVNNISILSRRHLVMVNMLSPSAARPVFSSDKVSSERDIASHLSGHMVWTALREIEKTLHRLGIGFFRHDCRELTYKTIANYIDIKQRQAL